ncbi:P-loop containing nucleoside triphosphate hydrolase protein [Blastocladiella britannica]|nr:P-loop containing nucleoside triphosphate hydrolase protein [Blastocladiella britannica]
MSAPIGKHKQLNPRRQRTTVDVGSSFFLSNWLYLWTFRLIHHARKGVRRLKLRLPENLTARTNGRLLDDAWQAEVKEKGLANAVVLNALKSAYMTHYGMIGLWKILWGVFTWLSAWYFLKQFVIFLEKSQSTQTGHLWAMAQLLACLAASISIHQLYGECAKEGVRIKSALTVLIYRKSLKLARVKGGAGEVINIVSTDVARVQDAVLNFHFLWTSVLETTLIIILAFYELGLSAFTTLGIILLLMPVQVYLGKITSEVQRENTEVTARRVHIMSELLTAIKLVKFYTWEREFTNKVGLVRKREMELIRKALVIKAFNFAFVFATPVIVAIVGLVTFKKTGNVLTSTVSFTILSVFNTLRYPLLMTPQAVKSFSGATVSLDRLTTFMRLPEVEAMPTLAPKDDTMVELKNASFAWDGDDHSTLQDITLSVKKGEILAVIGSVGAGKSSFIAALLGQMSKRKGEAALFGSTSYVPQEAWLLNFTLRDNITFGSDYEQGKFDETIRVCALQRDLTLLAAAEYTEIAERGANLSGGQRQRTSLARAVYADKDIVLLDDPLSAVDQAVGRHIFEECIKGHLKGKTIIFVTHQLQYLPQVDKVIQIKDGKIAKYGTYDELMSKHADFADLINSHVAAGEDGDDDVEAMPLEPMVGNSVPVTMSPTADKAGGAAAAAMGGAAIELNQMTMRSHKNIQINEATIQSMIERNQLSVVRGGNATSHDLSEVIQRNQATIHSVKDFDAAALQAEKDLKAADGDSSDDEDDEDSAVREQRKKGQLVGEDKSVESRGFLDYVSYATAGNGVEWTIFTCIFFFLVHGVRIGSDYWLKLWIPNSLNLAEDAVDPVYMGTYGGFALLFTIGVLTRGLLFAREASAKAEELHNSMFDRILRAPMSFYDTTPLGRILSAFSKHQFNIDETMPDSAMQALQYVPLTMGALILIMIIVPWNWAPALFMLCVAGLAIYWVTPAENAVKAAEAATKPPIFSHLAVTLEGLFSIRAYRAESRFDGLNMDKLDANHEQFLGLSLIKSWTALYMDLITSVVIYVTALFMVLFQDELGGTAKARSSTGGLAMSNALQILVFLQWSIRMIGEVQSQMASVGIMDFYSSVAQEAPDEVPETEPPASWPEHGVVKFDDIVLKYQEFGVAVLKNVTLDIRPQEKIGIVGRTGSGKSTLLVSLLRIVEACNGKVTIDGVDVSKIGLRKLRETIAIIPQEPIMFLGTIRSNLDPFNKSTDDEIWHALEAVHLKDRIWSMPQRLESPVVENGKNFSVGARQCLCISRAILSKTKILVLDEATAAIDMQTDALIQTAIKENFAHLTVLTIAHRLNTIIESDRVIVMEGGRLMEFDSPHNLLQIPGGHFASLVGNTGPATSAKLHSIALEAHEARMAAAAAGMSTPGVTAAAMHVPLPISPTSPTLGPRHDHDAAAATDALL